MDIFVWKRVSNALKKPYCPGNRFSMGSTVFLGLVQTKLYCNVFFQTVKDNVHHHWWVCTSSCLWRVSCQESDCTIQFLTQKKCRSRTVISIFIFIFIFSLPFFIFCLPYYKVLWGEPTLPKLSAPLLLILKFYLILFLILVYLIRWGGGGPGVLPIVLFKSSPLGICLLEKLTGGWHFVLPCLCCSLALVQVFLSDDTAMSLNTANLMCDCSSYPHIDSTCRHPRSFLKP